MYFKAPFLFFKLVLKLFFIFLPETREKLFSVMTLNILTKITFVLSRILPQNITAQ